jgi:hypothetical protein
MGKRGPKQRPTALAVAAGTRASRINLDTPTGTGGDPSPSKIFFDGFPGSPVDVESASHVASEFYDLMYNSH